MHILKKIAVYSGHTMGALLALTVALGMVAFFFHVLLPSEERRVRIQEKLAVGVILDTAATFEKLATAKPTTSAGDDNLPVAAPDLLTVYERCVLVEKTVRVRPPGFQSHSEAFNRLKTGAFQSCIDLGKAAKVHPLTYTELKHSAAGFTQIAQTFSLKVSTERQAEYAQSLKTAAHTVESMGNWSHTE